MAKLIRSDEVTIVNRCPVFHYRWEGIGIAYISDFWYRCEGHITILGDLILRIIRSENFPLPGGVYIVKNNWRWPLWWLLLQIWLFLRWFERNLRLTAAVWGLLRCEMGDMPRWSDFVVWRWMKKHR